MKKYPDRKTDSIGCIFTLIVGFAMLSAFSSALSKCSCSSSNQTYVPQPKQGEKVACPSCNGTGKQHHVLLNQDLNCSQCKGEGRIEKR